MSLLSVSILGLSLAIVASVGFALQYIFVRIGTKSGRVEDVVWISLLCNTAIIVPLAVVFSKGVVSPRSIMAFVAAGVAGALLSRVLMFESIQRIGASRTSPIVASNVIFATIFAMFAFGDTVTLIHLLGIVTIVVSIAYISYETSFTLESVNQNLSVKTIALPLSAAVLSGVEPILINIGLSADSSILSGLAITVSTAFVGFTTYLAVSTGIPRPEMISDPEFKWHLAAGLIITISMLSYFAALESAPVVFVVPIIQTSPLFIILISIVMLPDQVEKITWRLTVAAVGVVMGASLVSVYG